MKFVFASLFALIVLAHSVARAEHPSVVQLVTKFNECTYHPITGVKTSCRQMQSGGTAVCVGEKDGQKVFATCWHCVREVIADPAMNRAWILVERQYVPVSVLSWEKTDDLALLTATVGISPVELDDAPQGGADVEALGYPAGTFSQVRQRITSRRDGNIYGNQSLGQGHSGGGLFCRGRLAGVLQATRDDGQPGSRAVDASVLRWLLDHGRVRYRCRGVVVARGAVVPPPVPPPPSIPTDTLPPPVGQPATAGVQGPPGPPGPKGDIGPMGPMGRDLAASALEGRVKALEEALAKAVAAKGDPGPPGTVTVILIGPDGKEAKRFETVESGSVVRLNVTKFLQKEM